MDQLINLTHEQQQEAVEKIQQLMQQGISSGEAIATVAQQLREQYSKPNSLKEGGRKKL